jgi:hypothetical protein
MHANSESVSSKINESDSQFEKFSSDHLSTSQSQTSSIRPYRAFGPSLISGEELGLAPAIRWPARQ